jgi:DNA polymerase III alpha subunit (gram-positive type)
MQHNKDYMSTVYTYVYVQTILKQILTEEKYLVTGAYMFIYVDVMLTEHEAELTQLSAMVVEGAEPAFSKYILPECPVGHHASALTGLSVQLHQGQRVLTHHGKIVPSQSAEDVLQNFTVWLPEGAVLLAHNGKSFDNPRLVRKLRKTGQYTSFTQKVTAIGDTLPLFKEAFPGLNCYTLSGLCDKILGHTYDAHDASEDCDALKKLTLHVLLTKPSVKVQSHCWTVESVNLDVKYKSEQHQRYATLVHLVDVKVISKAIGKKIAGSGLNYDHLKRIVERGGLDGLSAVFKAKCGNSCRVTASKKILDAIFQHFNAN